jgi:hypothetical protein
VRRTLSDARERHAPLWVPFPIEEGATWENVLEEKGYVLSRDASSGAWKVRLGETLFWWSEERAIPTAIERGGKRWELKP